MAMNIGGEKHGKKARRRVLSYLILLVLAPATVWLAWKFGDRKFYITSVLLIVYAMLPFFFVFEHKRPQARELVVLAVLCAIAVASRGAFVWAANFKPMAAVIMIAGMAFGAEAGFLVGAVSAFVSNFFFGQGIWTPWQMFAFAMAGFLAGALFRRSAWQENRVLLAVFGGAAILLVVGPLLDTCTLFTMTTEITPASAAAIYLSGLPVNAVHALATVLTLLLAAHPMLEKLRRIQTKYGLLEERHEV